jgi:hypothetical protein
MSDLSILKGMCPSYSGGFSAESLVRSLSLLLFVSSEYARGFFDNSVYRRILASLREFSVPRAILFGPAAPSMYSSQGFGPSSYSFRASSAFDVFESGLRSLELFFSGQQRLRCIRVRASVPRINFFRASSAFDIFESGLRSLELTLVGPAAPSSYSFRARSAFELFRSFGSLLSTQ